jgi:hypothetical protein
MQVSGEGNIAVGAGVDGAIFIVVLGDCDLLGSGKLLDGRWSSPSPKRERRRARASSRVLLVVATMTTKASCS